MATKVYECLKAIGEVIEANRDFLTELDREIGDADHGVNMSRGFQAVIEKLPQDNEDIGAMLKKTGMTLLSTVGGASGPLYGTAYMEAGKVTAGKTSITAEDFQQILRAAIAGIQKRGKAVQGEKTMLDALIPAEAAFAGAVEAAEEGVAYTKTIRATKGRASYLGDRSIGHQDPGATSATLTLETIRDFLKG